MTSASAGRFAVVVVADAPAAAAPTEGRSSSSRRIGTTTTSVVLLYSGVAIIVTVSVSKPDSPARWICAQRMAWACTMPLGVPVVPDE